MMLLFFATIGAGAGSLTALRSTGWLTAFIAIQLGVHMAVIIFGGCVLAGLPMQVSCMPKILVVAATFAGWIRWNAMAVSVSLYQTCKVWSSNINN